MKNRITPEQIQKLVEAYKKHGYHAAAEEIFDVIHEVDYKAAMRSLNEVP